MLAGGHSPPWLLGGTTLGPVTGRFASGGILLGEIGQLSTRLADAIITKECLDILLAATSPQQIDQITLPATIWRTLCADRGSNGEPAPRVFRLALDHLLRINNAKSRQTRFAAAASLGELVQTMSRSYWRMPMSLST